MYNYVRVILILYKPLDEDNKFLTLCFSPPKPKYLLRVHYSPRLYSLTSRLLPSTFRHNLVCRKMDRVVVLPRQILVSMYASFYHNMSIAHPNKVADGAITAA
jgi:hypothetical protein